MSPGEDENLFPNIRYRNGARRTVVLVLLTIQTSKKNIDMLICIGSLCYVEVLTC